MPLLTLFAFLFHEPCWGGSDSAFYVLLVLENVLFLKKNEKIIFVLLFFSLYFSLLFLVEDAESVFRFSYIWKIASVGPFLER